MRQRHAISPQFFGHYQDLGISSLKGYDSACNIILSVGSPANLASFAEIVCVMKKTNVQVRFWILCLVHRIQLPFHDCPWLCPLCNM